MRNFNYIADSAVTTEQEPDRFLGQPVWGEDGDYLPAIWRAPGGGYLFGYMTPDEIFVTFSPVEFDRMRALVSALSITVAMVLPR